MAKNWNLSEVVNAVVEGGDAYKEMVVDAGKRFPLTVSMVSGIISASTNVSKDYFQMLVNALPEYITARKIEKTLKSGINDEDNEDDEVDNEEEENKEVKPTKEKKTKAKKTSKKEIVEEEDDDDDEEEDEEEIKSKKVKSKKAKSKKAKKVVEEDDDDDDDWDI